MNRLRYCRQLLFHEVWRLRWRIRTKLFPYKYHRDPYVKDGWYMINPEKVTLVSSREFPFYRKDGSIIAGNWDIIGIKKFEEQDFFTSFRDHAYNNIPWVKTAYYQRVVSEITQGTVKWGCKTIEDFNKRIRKLDLIYEDIKRNGYRQIDKDASITINIGRHGDLLFNGGRHRMTFCKDLGIEEIPVRTTVRHAKWVHFKNEILEYACKRNGKVYSPLRHIDLQSVPSHYGHIRYELISKNLSLRQGTLLDIGSNWGYFCHRFEEEGFSCVAVENNLTNLYFLRKLKRAENRRFEIVTQSALEFVEEKKKIDVVLALAIFHHFIKEENTYHGLIRLLGNLEMKEMYFMPHLPKQKQMEGAFKNFDPEEFARFVIEHSCLNHAKLIGYAEDDRPMYKLYI